MDLPKALDCTVGACSAAFFVWVGDHWMAVLGAALLVWRSLQAFVLEPMGYAVEPGWLMRAYQRRVRRRRRRGQ